MALPKLLSTNAFDASYAHTFKFTYDGNQVRKTRLIIFNNQTNDIVFDETIDNLQLNHVLPENTLTNGILYNAAIECFDKDNISSGLSNKIIFYCFASPTFEFLNISDNLTIENSSIKPTLLYSQIEGELLNSYQFLLYNFNKILISQSGIKYDTANMYGNFSNLEESNYFIRAIGETVNGMSLDTGYVGFTVNYDTPNEFSLLEVANIENEGRIKLKSNIVGMSGYSSDGSEVNYIDNEMIDLTDGKKVIFDKGFSISGDFQYSLIWYGLPIYNQTFVEFEDLMGNKLVLSWRKGIYESNNNIEKTFVKLEVSNTLTYMTISNFIDTPSPTDKTIIWLKRLNHVYDIRISII